MLGEVVSRVRGVDPLMRQNCVTFKESVSWLCETEFWPRRKILRNTSPPSNGGLSDLFQAQAKVLGHPCLRRIEWRGTEVGEFDGRSGTAFAGELCCTIYRSVMSVLVNQGHCWFRA